jgi:hypothetical protein
LWVIFASTKVGAVALQTGWLCFCIVFVKLAVLQFSWSVTEESWIFSEKTVSYKELKRVQNDISFLHEDCSGHLNVGFTVTALVQKDICFALNHMFNVLNISFGAAHSIIHDHLICCEVCAFYLEECQQEEFQQSTSWHSSYYWNRLKTGISGSPSTSVYSSPRPISYLICGEHKDAYRGC